MEVLPVNLQAPLLLISCDFLLRLYSSDGYKDHFMLMFSKKVYASLFPFLCLLFFTTVFNMNVLCSLNSYRNHWPHQSQKWNFKCFLGTMLQIHLRTNSKIFIIFVKGICILYCKSNKFCILKFKTYNFFQEKLPFSSSQLNVKPYGRVRHEQLSISRSTRRLPQANCRPSRTYPYIPFLTRFPITVFCTVHWGMLEE